MPLRGNLEDVSRHSLKGWAWDDEAPAAPVNLVVSVDGNVRAHCLANLQRPDLQEAAIGEGRHGFSLSFAPPLSPYGRHVVMVRREGDGAHLPGSPHVLEPTAAFDEAIRTGIAQILTTTTSSELADRLAFVTEIADNLRQLHADAQSDLMGREARQRRRLGETHSGLASAADPKEQPRALVVDDRVPLSDHDAGSNAVLSHIRALQRLGYAVTFAPANLSGDAGLLAAEGVACCLRPWYGSVEDVLRRQHGAFTLVYLHRVSTAARYLMLARDYQPRAFLIYSVADLHHLRLGQQAEIERRPELAEAAQYMRLAELSAAQLADAVITYSTSEAVLLRQHVRPEKVHVVPWTVALNSTAMPLQERRGFAFIGGFGHQPNVDAAHWLIDGIVPELEAQGSMIPCMLVGSDMPESLRRLRPHSVEPIGHVSNLSTVFDRVRLTIAPLAFGAGVKGKVLDSLAAGVPCVCTTVAADGLDLPESLRDLVADTSGGLARSILALHQDKVLNQTCAEAGLNYIATMNSESHVDALLQAAIGTAK